MFRRAGATPPRHGTRPGGNEVSPLRLIDLHNRGTDRSIGTWVVEDEILVDPGPASTLPRLLSALDDGWRPRAIALTHIHLDHAGATGALLGLWPDCEVWVHSRGRGISSTRPGSSSPRDSFTATNSRACSARCNLCRSTPSAAGGRRVDRTVSGIRHSRPRTAPRGVPAQVSRCGLRRRRCRGSDSAVELRPAADDATRVRRAGLARFNRSDRARGSHPGGPDPLRILR